MNTQKLPGELFKLTVHRNDAGTWYVTCSSHKGFLTFGANLAEALDKVPGALTALELAETIKDQ